LTESLAFRAHARLLTMLGEQLIKNERIALVELVKNAYDADATIVDVDFQNFGSDLSATQESAIVITDNGTGMTPAVIRNAWMNPATPSKALSKRDQPRTPAGRILQGEKGIGRFATFKLGSQVLLTTRSESASKESTLLVDISQLDDDSGDDMRSDFYLDDIAALLDEGSPHVFTGHSPAPAHGTRLEIRALRADWSTALVHEAFDDLDRLQPLMWGEHERDLRADFKVRFLADGVDLRLDAQRFEEFQAVLERAVLRVTNGRFDVIDRAFSFDLNGRPVRLSIDDSEIRGLRLFRQTFVESPDSMAAPECGSFGFEFFIFDFSNTAPPKHQVDSEEKALLQRHRVYLYRDGIRVYPYGDPGDDWLQVDVIRGTQSARSIFSNDQTVGFVTISQAENPQLRDKTNREGLLETGRATGDLIALIQTVLSYLRAKPYEQYAAANRRARERGLEQKRVEKHVAALRSSNTLPASALSQLDELESAVQAERDLATLQVARTEQLAGVGLSVETASHDLIAAGTEALRLARQIVGELRLLDLTREPVFGIASALVTQLEFISGRFRDVQGLFVSTRQKQAKLDVLQLVRRVKSMYSSLHKESEIDFEVAGNSLIVTTTEGAILQCVINLVDNATYWLMTSPHKPRLLRVYVDDPATLVVTDNGPGVKPQDEPFVFEPFYSGKGDAGKGLGLYIARQNGLRSGFDVQLEKPLDDRALPGATFTIRFGSEETS
jgi:signal transduction histidine kinase